jgi:hypothetical protein
VRSDEALDRVTALRGVNSHTLGEAHTLLGSNDQSRWRKEWSALTVLEDRQREALRSPFLLSALDHYRDGFQIDPTYYYSGISALTMATVLTEVAAAQPDVWIERFESEQEAAFQLEDHKRLRGQLAAAVEFSLAAAKRRATRDHDESDPWLPISVADCAFLLGKSNVRQCYRDALSRVEAYRARVARRQFELFRSLGLMAKSVNAVEPLFDEEAQEKGNGGACKLLLFTGHRLDAPDRCPPRFPAAQESAAREAIRNAVLQELKPGIRTIGIAGGASGGDLLFHEICEELGIERTLCLIVPRDEYVRASVAPSGPNWIERFNRQFESAKTRVYQQSLELPLWLQGKPEYTLWQRSDAWILDNALALGGPNTTLIALWDGRTGEGPGGTEHMVHSATERGARTLILDTNAVFGFNSDVRVAEIS